MTATQVWTIVGALLILWGTGVAFRVVMDDRRAHAIRARLGIWLAELWRRVRRRPVPTVTTSGTAHASVRLGGEAWKVMDGTEPLEELGPWLVEQIAALRGSVTAVRQEAGAATRDVRRRLDVVERERDDQRIATRERVAVGSARQMLSLSLIGFGTLVTLVPALLGW